MKDAKDALEVITQKALSIPEQAEVITITDNASYEEAANILLVIKDLREEIDETFDPIIRRANEAHKEAIAQKKKAESPLVEAEKYLKSQMVKYSMEKERERKEMEERLRAEALKREEEERLKMAIELEQAGAKDEANAIIEESIHIPPVSLPQSTPKVSGIAMQERWTYKIVDEALIPRKYLKPDEVKIGQIVRALKGNHGIPGIEAYPEVGISAGRRRQNNENI